MKLLRQFRSHLLWKIITWYLICLLIPCLLFAGIYFLVNQSYYATERRQLEKVALSRCCNEVERNMDTCASVYFQIQQHSNFLRFLNGGYGSLSAQLAAYFKEFSSMFTFAESYSSYIETVKVYALQSNLLHMNDNVDSIEELGDYTLNQQTNNGYWRYDAQTQRFIYRKTLHSVQWDATLGILEISCYPEILSIPLEGLSQSVLREGYVIYEDNSYVFHGNTVSEYEGDSEEKDLFAECGLLPMRICLGPYEENNSQEWLNVLSLTTFLGVLVMVLCSIVFFFYVSKLSHRIVEFSKYLSRSYTAVPQKYVDSGNDEFSLLVQNFNTMLENNNHLVSQMKLEKLRQSEMAYRVLQAQIDPHFIYNALESIRMMAEIHDEPEMADVIFSLSKLLRYTFSVSTKEVTIAQELDLVQQYMKIQTLRMGDSLAFQLVCPEDVVHFRCPQFIMQPLVENAVKYGRNQQKLTISVRVSLEGARLTIVVENDGASMDVEKMQKINERLSQGLGISEFSSGTGIGLESVNQRMRYLYPLSFRMELALPDQGSGLVVTLSWEPSEENADGEKEEYDEGVGSR